VLLVVRLGGDESADGLDRDQWQRVIVEAVHWLGPIRVCFRGAAAHSPYLVPLVRFANRLECPTHLVTAGPLAPDLAMALVDAGLAAATVRIGSLDDRAHADRTGTPLSETLASLDHLRKAREDRGRPLALLAALCLASDTVGSLGAMAGLARQTGVDGVLASAPANVELPSGAGQAVAALGEHDTHPALLGGGGRSSRRSLGLRLEVLPDGTLRTSRRLAPLGQWAQDQLQALWEAGGSNVTDALDLDRPADEIERVPAVLYSTR